MTRPLPSSQFDEPNIGSLRGFACVLLVAYHASLGALDNSHTQSEVLSFFNAVFSPIRMPLFSFLSGYVYAYGPASRESLARFATSKARRLVIPFIAMTILMLGIKTLVPRMGGPTIVDVPHHLVFAFSHLWFLQAIVIVFAIIALADCVSLSRRNLVVLGTVCLSLLAYFTPLRKIEPFSIGQAFYLLPFFAAGRASNTYSKVLTRNKNKLVPLTLVLILLSLVAGILEVAASGIVSPRGTCALVMGFSSLMFLILTFPSSRALSIVGSYSFTIFLFHSIFIAIALRLGPGNLWGSLPVIVIIALFGPMSVEMLIHRRAPQMTWLIGQRSLRTRTTGAPDWALKDSAAQVQPAEPLRSAAQLEGELGRVTAKRVGSHHPDTPSGSASLREAA